MVFDHKIAVFPLLLCTVCPAVSICATHASHDHFNASLSDTAIPVFWHLHICWLDDLDGLLTVQLYDATLLRMVDLCIHPGRVYVCYSFIHPASNVPSNFVAFSRCIRVCLSNYASNDLELK